jgi:polyhydroxybutyrate depolymerase
MLRPVLQTLCFLALTLGFAVPTAFAAEPIRREWTIDGAKREALVVIPESAPQTPSPVVFGFHGHGGSMRNAARTFRIHQHWPEAIVVYMQGLNTPGRLTDPEGKKPGWQSAKGDQDDRDLKFFDDVLKSLRQELKVDDSRIYSTGHSNGGGFTYLLWAERSDVFAAMAPSGSAALRTRGQLKPKPVLHIAGSNDPLVKFSWQSMMIDSLKKSQKCGVGTPWKDVCTEYPSEIGAPVVTMITENGHRFPPKAPEIIVAFFRQHAKKLANE